MADTIKILAIGDIVGRTGRDILQSRLQGLIDRYRVDLVIANGENAAGGKSITGKITHNLLAMGVDVITTGNHIWDKKDVLEVIDNEPCLLRPANFPPGVMGKGHCVVNRRGYRVAVINLQGRVHMVPLDCPFRAFDLLYNEMKDNADVIIVDFHAEATSEKKALGWYADGRASLVFGTHTHVQTADEAILPRGTGYITDIGMTGSFDSVIGMSREASIERFLTQIRTANEVARDNPGINGIMVTINRSGKTEEIERLVV